MWRDPKWATAISNFAIIAAAILMKLLSHRIIDSIWNRTTLGRLYPGHGTRRSRVITDGKMPEDPVVLTADSKSGDGKHAENVSEDQRNLALTEVCYFAEMTAFYTLIVATIINALGKIDVLGTLFGTAGVLALVFGRGLLDYGHPLDYFKKRRFGSPSSWHLGIVVILNLEPLARFVILDVVAK